MQWFAFNEGRPTGTLLMLDLDCTTLLVAQGVPTFNGHYWLLLASRLLHILSAIILLGGIFYLRMVVAPSQPAGSGNSDAWFSGQRGTWAKWVGITTLLLVATGLFNFVSNVKTYQIATSYHMLVGLKILVALVVFFLAAVLAGRSMMAERMRSNMRFWLSVCLIAGILAVAIGSVMRTWPRELKPTAGPALIAPR